MQEKWQYGKVEIAIVRVLRKHPKGLRYNALKKESDDMLRSSSGKGVCIRTFNKLLSRLVRAGIVRRNEVTRFKVFYKVTETPEQKEFRSVAQKFLLSWKNDLTELVTLSKALVHAGCKEKEALRKSNFPEMETYMEIVCENMVELATMWAKAGLLTILASEATEQALSRFTVEELAETLHNIFADAADWVEKAGEGQLLLIQFFREIQAKFYKELAEKNYAYRKELASKIFRKLRDEGV